jgi:hypothetical protein
MQPKLILDRAQCFCVAKTTSNRTRTQAMHFALRANGKAKLGILSPRDSFLCGLPVRHVPSLSWPPFVGGPATGKGGARGAAGGGEEPGRSSSRLAARAPRRSMTRIGHSTVELSVLSSNRSWASSPPGGGPSPRRALPRRRPLPTSMEQHRR